MPYSLSEEQIDFILSDIKARGIEIEKLQINLLDHVCCLLEQRMKEGDDLKSVYEEIITEFHESNLKEIEKEAKGLIRSKHHYKMKGFLYFVFIVSLGYNLYAIADIVIIYFEMKKWQEEYFVQPEFTLKNGYDELKEKLRKKYPATKIQNYTCVTFRYHYTLERQDFWILDSLSMKHWDSQRKYEYRNLDNLAKIYPNVTFVVAFQGTGDDVKNIIKKYSAETERLLYVDGMNKLMSGFQNEKKTNGVSFPTLFILDNNGKVIYDCKYFVEEIFFTNKFLRTLPTI
jgi:hypothetical protein